MDRSATLLLAVIAASPGGAQGDKPDPAKFLTQPQGSIETIDAYLD